jgi:hypothetical protein
MGLSTWIKVNLGLRVPGENLSGSIVRSPRGSVLRRVIGNSCKTFLSVYAIIIPGSL